MKLFNALGLAALLSLTACDIETSQQGDRVEVEVERNADGLTTEQANIQAYRGWDSDPQGIKHFYVFNEAGTCIFYDVIAGKATSSGKRLRPRTVVVASTDGMNSNDGLSVDINGRRYETAEVPSWDGTWGTSVEYIYWRNTAGFFRKLHVGAGMSWISSDQEVPLQESPSVDLTLLKADMAREGR